MILTAMRKTESSEVKERMDIDFEKRSFVEFLKVLGKIDKEMKN